MKWGSLNDPWGDQIKGSWWKAPLLIFVYFYLRLYGELYVMSQSYQELGITIQDTMEMTAEQTSHLFAIMEWPYFLLALALTLFVVIVSYLLGFRFFNLKTFSLKNLLKTIGIFIGGFILQIALSNLIVNLNPDYVQPINQRFVEEMVRGMNTILMFLNIVILTPIVEEYLLRGLIMKYIFSLMPKLGALVAAVVFALLHSPQNITDFAIYFLLSAVLTGTYWYTRRLEYPIIIHMIQNFLGFLVI